MNPPVSTVGGGFRGEGLVAGYTTAPVLKAVDFSVGGGQIVAVLGSNGAGKSTLARTIAGLVPIRDGRLVADGVSLERARPDGRVSAGVSLVPEGRLLFPNLTVHDNLAVGSIRCSRPARRDALGEVVELFPQLGTRLHQKAGSLSGGEQQMLAVGRALMARPRYLVLDEPSLGLAPIIVTRILDKVRALADSGMGVLLIEQNASLALSISDRALVIERGAVIATGTASELRSDPVVVRAYLGGRQADRNQQHQSGREAAMTNGRLT